MDFKNYNVIDGFNTIAHVYDRVNDAMTFGLHRRWRKALCTRAAAVVGKNGLILDLATGTGDVILGLADHPKHFSLYGVDPAAEMLKIAKHKLSRHLLTPQDKEDDRIRLSVGDGRHLNFADNTFDAVTISWGIRNITPMKEGLGEILRVLKPNGTVLILESGLPELKPMRLVYKGYSKIVPFIGAGFSKFKKAYDYYIHSVNAFPSGSAFTAILYEVGFVKAQYTPLTGGVVYLYEAKKSGH